MAPKTQKRKPATKRSDKSEVEIMSEPRHNQVAYLDPEDKLDEYKGITRWLRESRINFAVTHETTVYKSLIKAFWDSAEVVEVDGKEVMRGRVNDRDIVVSVEIINTVLQLGDDPEAPFSVPLQCQRGCLRRMKCIGDILGKQLNKSSLPLRYKFLLHVLIQCLSNRRSGYDRANNDLVGLMVALVLNKPFNISKYIFANMKENLRRTGSVTGGSKFWMYPRFLQMIMNVQHPNLPKEDNDILKVDVMKDISLKILKGFSAKSYKESDPPRKLFGFLDNNAYVAPENDKWRHDNSESDDEEPTLNKKIEDIFGNKSESDDDDSDDEGGDGTGVASAPESGSYDNPPEPGYEHYIDERGIRQLRRTRTDRDQDEDYVPSDTESEKARKKQVAIQRKKKSRKTIGESQAQPSSTRPSEPVQEAAVMTASLFETAQPPQTTTSATETPIVPPPVEPQQAGTSSSLRQQSEAHQRSSAHHVRLFSEMDPDEKVEFLFSQLQAAAGQINRHSEIILLNHQTNITQQLQIHTLKEVVQKQQTEIEQLRAENVQLRAADKSFDYPGDTFLPGMKFGKDLVTGLDRRWKSLDDPSPGEFVGFMDTNGGPDPGKELPIYVTNLGYVVQIGRCNPQNSPACSCMEGFEPRKPDEWSASEWSSGCRRRTPLDCPNGDGFQVFKNIKLPYTRRSWYNMNMTLDECASACKSNCSCMAYANIFFTNGGSRCLLWFDDLMDVRTVEESQDLYVRMAQSDITIPESSSNKKREIIIVAVFISAR
ncbi:putative non-specific protein-tyrosine kinase [Helianthus anomalus]